MRLDIEVGLEQQPVAIVAKPQGPGGLTGHDPRRVVVHAKCERAVPDRARKRAGRHDLFGPIVTVIRLVEDRDVPDQPTTPDAASGRTSASATSRRRSRAAASARQLPVTPRQVAQTAVATREPSPIRPTGWSLPHRSHRAGMCASFSRFARTLVVIAEP